MKKLKRISFKNSPIIIGGNGHSGTRLPVALLRQGGINFGSVPFSRRSNSDDCRNIWLLNRWCSRSLRKSQSEGELQRMKWEFLGWLRILFPSRAQPWGFKNPRTIMLLPFFDSIFKDMKFIHVIRDGRDMAFDNIFGNENAYAHYFLEQNESKLRNSERMALFWARLNLQAFQYGTTEMTNRYLFIRLEDFCSEPVTSIQTIYQFVGIQPVSLEDLVATIKKPKSLGRWKTAPEEEVNSVTRLIRHELNLFGYT